MEETGRKGIAVRKAAPGDMGGLQRLLAHISELHHIGRPDIFTGGASKYNEAELKEILGDADRPVFVAADSAGSVLGYCFCIVKRNAGHAVIKDYTSLYIDDFCVGEECRRQGVGKMLFDAAKKYAASINAYEIDLNVWEFNEGAIKFYERCGFKTQRRHMEYFL